MELIIQAVIGVVTAAGTIGGVLYAVHRSSRSDEREEAEREREVRERLVRIEGKVENGIANSLARVENHTAEIFNRLGKLPCESHATTIAQLQREADRPRPCETHAVLLEELRRERNSQ